jgi:lipopolysaccharide export system permease protein
MNIATRYIFRQLLLATVFITIILTLSIWLTQSLKFIDFVINRGFPLSTFFSFILLLIPDLIGIVLPLSLLVATLFVYHRLYNDSELIVLRANGFSNFSLSRPAIILAFFAMILLYAINLYFLPVSFQHFKNMEYEIRNKIGTHSIRAGEFNTFKNYTLYVRSRTKAGHLKGILLQDDKVPSYPVTLIAQEGSLMETPEGIKIVMINGHRQEIDKKTQKPMVLWFEQYTLNLSTSFKTLEPRQLKPYERFIGDLLNPSDSEVSASFASRLKAEAHQRLLLPLTVFSFIFIALSIFLNGDYNRRRNIKKIAGIIALCGVFEALVISLIHLSDRFVLAIPFAYLLIIVSGIFAFYSLDRSVSFSGRKCFGFLFHRKSLT